MTATVAVVLTADDAAFLAAALRKLTQLLDHRYQRPAHRVIELERQLTRAAQHSVDATPELPYPDGSASSAVTADALDVTTAAQQLACSPENVRAMCRRGTLPATRHAGRWYIPADAVADRLHHRKEP